MGPKTKGRMSDLRWPVAMATAFPAVIIGVWLILGDRLPPEALAVMVGTFAMSLVWAALGIAFRAAEARAEPELAGLAAGVPGLELVYTIPSVTVPCGVTVVGAIGACPRGLQINDSIAIGEDGRLSSPLCRTAAEALELILLRVSRRTSYEHPVSCLCPLAGRSVTFALRPSSLVGAS